MLNFLRKKGSVKLLEEEKITRELTQVQKWWEGFYPEALKFGIRLVIAFVIYFIGKRIIKLVIKIARRAFDKGNMEVSAANFICSLIKALLYSLLFIAIFFLFDGPQASLVALIGSVGLTIGLALQGSLSNFAGGVLILILKPFRIGDYIVANGKEGSVISIDIIYTKVLTYDNKLIVFPNGNLANTEIVNVTNEPIRRIELIIPLSYKDDIKAVKSELYQLCLSKDKILQEESIDIFVSNYGSYAVELTLRVYTPKEDFMATKSELLEEIKYMFDSKGFTIPTQHMSVSLNQGCGH